MAIHVRHHTRDKHAFRLTCSLFAVITCIVSAIPLSAVHVFSSHKKTAISRNIQTEKKEEKQPETKNKPAFKEHILELPEPLLIVDTSWELPLYVEAYIDIHAEETETTTEYLLFPMADLSECEAESDASHTKHGNDKQAALKEATYTPPQYKLTPQPEYPKELARKRINGQVHVRIQIDANGIPTGVEIVSSTHPAFAKAVNEKIMEDWRFSPAKSDNTPVASTVTTTINFKYSPQ